jgi:hypothetical protein
MTKPSAPCKKVILLFSFMYCVVAAIIIGCASSGIDVFYIDKGILQYYIRTSEFTGEKGKALIDFTCRIQKENPSATCNFSVAGLFRGSQKPDSAYFMLDGGRAIVTLDSIETLFIEGSAKTVRFTCRLPGAGFIELSRTREMQFCIVFKGKRYLYHPGKSFYRKIRSLLEDIDASARITILELEELA